MICPKCGKIFKDLGCYNRHVAGHEGDKPLKECDLCDYRGNTRNLYQHKINVHEERQFSCKNCEKMFATKSNLNKHFKMEHEFQNHKSHVCATCGKQLSSKQR